MYNSNKSLKGTLRNGTTSYGNKYDLHQISPDTNHHLSYRISRPSITKKQHQHQKQDEQDYTTENVYIRPFELSVDIMQYLVNTGKLFKITERTSLGSASKNWRSANPNTKMTEYLSIIDFPSIQIEQSDETRATSRYQGFYYDVYESQEVPMMGKAELLANFLDGWYYNNLMVKLQDTDGTARLRKSRQNISYVKNAIESLQAPGGATNWTCDLAGIPEKYVFRVEVADTGGKRHMIVGYPSARTMRQYTDLYDAGIGEGAIRDIHEQMKHNSTRQFAELYNFALDKGVADGKIPPEKAAGDKINIDNLEEEIYKFALGNRPYFFNSIINGYKQLAQDGKITKEEATRFESVFNENIREYYNAIGNKYLNKPITRIRYTFFILEAADETHTLAQEARLQWIPAVYNIRQLEARHLPVLMELERIIKLEIPLLYDIISKADYNAGLRYELFHSYYKYVNFFHITTEYLHTMSNYTDYAHNLKDSITLEEIIYSVGRQVDLGRPFYAGLRFDYKIRNYRLDYRLDYEGMEKDMSANAYSASSIGNSRRSRRYTNVKKTAKKNIGFSRRSLKNKESIEHMKLHDIEILLMYEETYANYTFIYKQKKSNGSISFRKMTLKPNLKGMKNLILDGISFANPKIKIKTVYECGNEFIKLLELEGNDIPRNYIIVSDDEIVYSNFTEILKYNPLVAKLIYSPSRNPTIDIRYFYQN